MQKFHSRFLLFPDPIFLFLKRLKRDINSASKGRFLLFSDLLLHPQLLFLLQLADHFGWHRPRVNVDSLAVGFGFKVEVVVLPLQLLLLHLFLLQVEFHPRFELLFGFISPAFGEQFAHLLFFFEFPPSLLIKGEQVEGFHRVADGPVEGFRPPVDFPVGQLVCN